jgi:tripartite-type tricarboxylate transporter receptor subunit TctC
MRNCICGLLLAGAAIAGTAAEADVYPGKPITLIVPYAAGSGMDAMSRIVAQALGDRLKQTMLIDNKAGANGTLGSSALARATPDGYTLGMGNSGTHASSPNLMKSVPYDPVANFAPIGRIGSFVFMLTVHSSVPATSLPELIAYSKANPGKLSYAVANSIGLSVPELLKSTLGFDATAVPYRSMPQAVTDLVAGRVSMLIVDRGPILPHLEAGTVRALMLTTAERSRLVPTVSSAREAGTDININSWVGMFAPVGVPNDIIERVSAELRKVVDDPPIRDQLEPAGFEAKSGGPDELAELVRSDVANWKRIVTKTGIQPQ